jgi:GT2 family glycosyltransferase
MLTVIIPTRNREKELTNLLEALSQTNSTISQIIIVDSSDEKFYKLNLGAYSNIVYHHTVIKSAAIQRNIGISFVDTNCKFLAFLDDDVLPNIDYFDKLINTLVNNSAIGVSGVAVNSKTLKKLNVRKLSEIYRYLFLLDSKRKGVILNSGVNIPVKATARSKIIVETEWLIGCALWDFQQIKNLRFENRLFGQSLGEDVLFSLTASRLGPLFVDSSVHLEHTESEKERPNQFEFYRMWVKNRYFIVNELTGTKYQPSFHWCNLGKSIILFVFIAKNPIKSITGLAGVFFGYFDLIRKQNAN